MPGSDAERHPLLSAQNLPRTSRFEEALYSLGDEWEVIEGVQLGHFTGLYAFLSVHGVFVVFPQSHYGVVDHYRYRLVIEGENLSRVAEAILKTTQNLSRVVGCKVTGIMLHRQLVDADEARDGFTDPRHPREWTFIGVKLMTWESFGPRLRNLRQVELTEDEVKNVRLRLRSLR